MRWWEPILSHGRGDLRRRGRSWLSLALLLGIAGGLVLAAWAGSRRTATAYRRLQEATDGFHVLVAPDDGDMDFDRIEGLSGVEAAGRFSAVAALPLRADGTPDLDAPFTVLAALDPRAAVTLNRPLVRRGRLAHSDEETAAVVTEDVARFLGVDVGDRVDLVSFDAEQIAALDELPEPGDDPAQLPTGTHAPVEVVGVVVFPEDTLVEPDNRQPFLLVSSAYYNRYRPAQAFTASWIRLSAGEGAVADFVAEAQRIDGEDQVFYQTSTALTTKARRAVRPYVGALGGFALAGAVATSLVIGQALARQIFVDSSDFPVLSAMGMTRGQLVAAMLGRVTVTALAGAAVAVVLAGVLSPLAPLGPARAAEPDPGFAVDWYGLGLGAAAIIVVPVMIAMIPAWLSARAATRTATDATTRRPSALANSLARAGAPLVGTTGVRMAFERGRGRTAVPVRATLVGTALSVGVLTTVIVLGSSLERLVSTPRLYGGNWDATYNGGPGGNGEGDTDEVDELGAGLAADADVEGLTVGGQAQLIVDGAPVPAVGLRPVKGDVTLTIVEGRPVAAEDEVVVGTNTLRGLGKGIGDDVLIGVEGSSRTYRVVGRAVFPLFAAYSGSDKTGLGDGIALEMDALAEIMPGVDESFLLLDLGGDPEAFERLSSDTGAGLVAPERPEDIVGYDRVAVVPYALTGLLILLGGGTTAHALVVGVRRRGRDLAILKTMGFERRQVAGVVAWQATAFAVVGFAVGLPAGLLVGSWIWEWFADWIGAVPEVVIALVPLTVIAAGTVISANAVAAVPARRAARMSPATILRAE